LDTVARETAQLADGGNQNAKRIVDELRKRGVTINPNPAPPPPLQQVGSEDPTIAFAARNPPGHYLTNTDRQSPVDTISSIEKFAALMRHLTPPTPFSRYSWRSRVACHTPTLRKANATVAALRNQPVNLDSDLLLLRIRHCQTVVCPW
jgi:hypothetical protein